MHQGYVLKLPNKFLQQHGGKIRDGLTVLKCMAAIGKCAGLPLSLEGMLPLLLLIRLLLLPLLLILYCIC